MNTLQQKYLRLLGLTEQQPTMEFLKRLIQAQQNKVPYENISKLLRRAENKLSIPDFEEFLNNLEEFNFGGTCYVQNGYFSQLLQHLGFNAELVASSTNGAAISHTGIRVTFGSEKYVVDLGLFSTFTGPFPLIPGQVVEVQTRNMLDRFTAMSETIFQMQHFTNGELRRTHQSQPESRTLEFFTEPIAQSFSKTSTFMTTIATHRLLESVPISLWGRVAYIAETRHDFSTPTELNAVYSKYLQLPRFPILRAIEILREYNGIDLFVPS